MSRIILLLIMATWLVGTENMPQPTLKLRPLLPLFFIGFLLLAVCVAATSRVLSRRLSNDDLYDSLRKFSRRVDLARWLIPIWLAAGFLPFFGWGALVMALTDPNYQLPALLLGTLPALLTWALLWWAEYPADRALREQSLLDQLERDLPVHAPPSFRRYVSLHLRQEMLPIVLPFFLVMAIRDGLLLTANLSLAFTGRSVAPNIQDFLIIPAALVVYLAAPEIFRRLLNARPLEDSALRRRLESICVRSNLRYRDILLWNTDNSMANALVIGILPGLRYVLLSDRLLETMPDQEIEAVFAHELGHIVHHHLGWFILFFITSTLVMLLAEQVGARYLWPYLSRYLNEDVIRVAGNALALGITLLVFGLLIRRFEHQADTYAARAMELELSYGLAEDRASTAPVLATPVGPLGAAAFNSALQRVAMINNIPLSARDFFHPTILQRLSFLNGLAAEPPLTYAFDLRIRAIKSLILVILLAASGISLALVFLPGA